MRSFSSSTCLIVTLVVAGAACHTRTPAAAAPSISTPVAPTAPARPPAPPAPPTAAARPAAPAALSEADLFRQKSLAQLNAEHPLGDAFFDYDQNVLRDEARTALKADATWLAKWPQTAVRIEGYCDERGSAEYNLALGERRARAVRDYLESLGIPEARINIVSLGKESSFCNGSTESCWSQNRRGHFVITAK